MAVDGRPGRPIRARSSIGRAASVAKPDGRRRSRAGRIAGRQRAPVVLTLRVGSPDARRLLFVGLGARKDEDALWEKVGGALNFDERRVKGDLERFKDMLEGRGTESGAWRGEVKQEDVTSS